MAPMVAPAGSSISSHGSPDHPARIAVAVHDRLQRLGRAAPQAVHRHDVAAPDVRQKLADGRLRGGDGDVDLPGLQQVDIASAG